MRERTTHQEVTSAVNEGWVEGSAFLGSILSGTVLGLLADRWLGTDPLLTVIGIIAGSVSGFFQMWRLLNKDVPRGR